MARPQPTGGDLEPDRAAKILRTTLNYAGTSPPTSTTSGSSSNASTSATGTPARPTGPPNCWWRRGGEAVEAVRPAVDVDPWNERAHAALAAGYRAMGHLTSARAVEARADDQLRELLAD